MKIKKRKVKDLIGAEYNPRKINETELEQLKDSIKRFGVVEPIIININKDRSDIIISGHQRLKACSDMGIKDVPTIELDLTLEKEKELNVRMNKAGGSFDYDMLQEHFEIADLLNYGFEEYQFTSDTDIEELFDDIEDDGKKSHVNKIVLEYTDEDYEKVIDKLAELEGTKEKIIYDLLII